MASSLTHIVLADKLYKKYFDSFDRQAFYVGVAFPDIRQLAHFGRELTHLPVTSIREVQQAVDPFLAGMLFHNLTDIKRETFVAEVGAHKLINSREHAVSLLKLYEDTQLYDRIDDWQGIIAMFDSALEAERRYPASHQDIEDWHMTLQRYFRQPPTPASRQHYIERLNLPAEWLADHEYVITELEMLPAAQAIAQQLFDDIERILDR